MWPDKNFGNLKYSKSNLYNLSFASSLGLPRARTGSPASKPNHRPVTIYTVTRSEVLCAMAVKINVGDWLFYQKVKVAGEVILWSRVTWPRRSDPHPKYQGLGVCGHLEVWNSGNYDYTLRFLRFFHTCIPNWDRHFTIFAFFHT